MLSKIIEVCYTNGKLVPRRNLKWLKKNHTSLFDNINEMFPGVPLPQVVVFLENNILSSNEIPKCKCGNNVIVYRGKLLKVCSNACSIKSKETQEKTKNTCIKKYGTSRKWGKTSYELGEHYTQKEYKNLKDTSNHKILSELQNQPWIKTAEHFGLSTNSHSSAYRFMESLGYKINTLNGTSYLEKEVQDFVSSLVEIKTNDRSVISPYELDIYIPSKKLAIEFNGLYWHSSGDILNDSIKNNHLNKTELCESKGIQLLHIFENEWVDENKKEIWKSIIKSKLGLCKRIYARKCTKVKISNKVALDFCKNNHIQGTTAGTSESYGLMYNNELVQVALFGSPRYNKDYDKELLRLCSKKGLTVVGGASKLTKGIQYISYANRRWSTGGVYNKLNLELIRKTSPCYFYIKGLNMYHRSSFMKHKLKNKLNNFNPNLTEVQNCYNNGLRRIWDSGNLVYAVRKRT